MEEDIFELAYKRPVNKNSGRRSIDRKTSPLEEEHLERIKNRYLDNICAFVSNVKIADPYTGKEHEPDENFMRSIEEKSDIGEQFASDFRRQILAQVGVSSIKKRKFNWNSNRKLGEAISKKLVEDLR